MQLIPLKYESNGKICMVLTDAGHHTGLLAYVAGSGQKNVDLNGRFEPYVWDEPSQSIRYSDKECEFHSGGYQVIREYGSSPRIQKVHVPDLWLRLR